jgi:molybdopterin synthase sulfur carrier subunit
MMPLHIFLNATLRQYVPGYDPYQGVSLAAPPGTPISQVIADLGLPVQEVALIMVDGRRREPDFALQGNERLGLFPPIGGG